MKSLQKLLLRAVVIVTASASLMGCSGMSRQDRNTLIGAGVGGVTGSVVTGGSAIGTVGGAAVGGVVGREID